jgi:hypothetical protein
VDLCRRPYRSLSRGNCGGSEGGGEGSGFLLRSALRVYGGQAGVQEGRGNPEFRIQDSEKARKGVRRMADGGWTGIRRSEGRGRNDGNFRIRIMITIRIMREKG